MNNKEEQAKQAKRKEIGKKLKAKIEEKPKPIYSSDAK